MNELESKFNVQYSNYLADFKTMSLDKEHPNKLPLCIDTYHKFYNFDAIVKEKYPNRHPASPDTLIFKFNTVYCVEFRNLSKTKVNKHKKNLQEKLQHGAKVLLKILADLSIEHKNLKFVFCVVYKKNNYNNKYNYASDIESQAVHFGLKDADKSNFYNRIYTQPVDFFRRQFIQKINKNLPC